MQTSDLKVTNDIQHIRNFAIIAHIDHGKSTLADRLIELCGALSAREMSAQVLDSMDLERERGITIKAQAVSLRYRSQQGEVYMLNLIDTPGHVDFAYEVSRSLAACEGALLLVDAQQGVEAQTVATCYHALAQNLVIVPVLNKIDLPQAEPERVCQEIEQIIGLDTTDICKISAKTGFGVVEMLEHVIRTVPPPALDSEPLRALIIDSWFDSYQGVVCLLRVFSGSVRRGEMIYLLHGQQTVSVVRLGKKTPKVTSVEELTLGEVGYACLGLKHIDAVPVGDTMTHPNHKQVTPLPGFQQVKPQVFAGLFPIDADQYEDLRDALSKLRLNDSALIFEPEVSQALGFGFRCGFLGLLHMEIVRERLEREYKLDLLTTAPSVAYEIVTKKDESMLVSNPAKLPEPALILVWKEPMVEVTMIIPESHIGAVIKLCTDRRGRQKNMQFTGQQVTLVYELPLNEIVIDFFDQLKSLTRGFGSMDYHFTEFVVSDLVKVDILVNGEKMDPLTLITHRSQSVRRGRMLIEKLKELIPRQMFEVALQATIGSQIIARSNVQGMRKNVIAKCYGGDISRKRKLLEKQKEGKKRMKQVGRVAIPQEAFLAILQVD